MQIKLYEDEDGVRRAEIEKLGGNNQFSMFYERLKEIKEYYRRNPMSEVTETHDDEAAINIQVLIIPCEVAVHGSHTAPSALTCGAFHSGATAVLWRRDVRALPRPTRVL